MNKKLKLKELTITNLTLITEMLFIKLNTINRYINEIYNLSIDNEKAILIPEYIENINKDELDSCRFVSIKNDIVDVVLRRYMMEAAMRNITVDFDIDPLENLSITSVIKVIEALEKCFSIIFESRPKSCFFIYIKNRESYMHICSDNNNKRIFDEKVNI